MGAARVAVKPRIDEIPPRVLAGVDWTADVYGPRLGAVWSIELDQRVCRSRVRFHGDEMPDFFFNLLRIAVDNGDL